jgi:hypothetical protein
VKKVLGFVAEVNVGDDCNRDIATEPKCSAEMHDGGHREQELESCATPRWGQKIPMSY